MKPEKWDARNKSLRTYFKFLTTLEALEKFPLRKTDKILELSLGDSDFSEQLAKKASHGAITHVDINARNLSNFMDAITGTHQETSSQINNFDYRNQFNVVFSCWIRHLIKADTQPVFEYIYRVLKGCGRALIIIPSINSSTTMTYQKVLENAEGPELVRLRHYEAEQHPLEEIKHTLKKSDFSDYKIIKMPHRVELPDLHMFRQFLHEIAFLYKPVMPTELSDKIIDMQVDYFDEYCQEHFEGKYFFEHNPYLIMAVK